MIRTEIICDECLAHEALTGTRATTNNIGLTKGVRIMVKMMKSFKEYSSLPTVLIPAGAIRLHDNEQWQMRFEICSDSSAKTYIIAQHKDQKFWACSCPGWKNRSRCKHIERFGLPADRQPYEVEGVRHVGEAQPPAPVLVKTRENATQGRVISFDPDDV